MNESYVVYVCDAQGQAPDWIRLLPLGQVDLDDGREGFIVDRESVDAMVAAFQSRGIDLVVDYEHQTLSGDKAPAAGWIKELQARDDGLWMRVEWTAAARQHIVAKEYRYFSPALRLEPKTRRPLRLLHVALTNTPAMNNLMPLAAKLKALGAQDAAKVAQETRAQKCGIRIKDGGNITKPAEWESVPDEQWGDPVNYRYPMPDRKQCQAAWSYWNQAKNQEQYTPAERGIIEKRIKSRAQAVGMQIQEAKTMKNKLLGLLALKAEATDDEVLQALGDRLALAGALPEIIQILALKADAPLGEVIGTIKGLKDGQNRLATVETELAALKVKLTDKEAQDAVDEALKAGKLTDAEKDLALEDAKRDVVAFKARMAVRPVVGPPTGDLKIKAKDGTTKTLSAEEALVCRAVGITPEAFKAEQDKQAAA